MWLVHRETGHSETGLIRGRQTLSSPSPASPGLSSSIPSSGNLLMALPSLRRDLSSLWNRGLLIFASSAPSRRLQHKLGNCHGGMGRVGECEHDWESLLAEHGERQLGCMSALSRGFPQPVAPILPAPVQGPLPSIRSLPLIQTKSQLDVISDGKETLDTMWKHGLYREFPTMTYSTTTGASPVHQSVSNWKDEVISNPGGENVSWQTR